MRVVVELVAHCRCGLRQATAAIVDQNHVEILGESVSDKFPCGRRHRNAGQNDNCRSIAGKLKIVQPDAIYGDVSSPNRRTHPTLLYWQTIAAGKPCGVRRKAIFFANKVHKPDCMCKYILCTKYFLASINWAHYCEPDCRPLSKEGARA